MGTCVPSPVRFNTFPVVFTSSLAHGTSPLQMVHSPLGQHDDLRRTLTRSRFLQFVLNFERCLAEYHPGGCDVLGIC